MTVLPGWLAAVLLGDGVSAVQVQPAGVDLRLDTVEELVEAGRLGVGERVRPRGRPIEPVDGWYRLGPGYYRIRFLDPVAVPSSAVGLCFPRSSLLRMGASVLCAVWDPGYRGRGEALLAVFNAYGVELERGARIAQLVFLRVGGAPGGLYEGVYQGEGLRGPGML